MCINLQDDGGELGTFASVIVALGAQELPSLGTSPLENRSTTCRSHPSPEPMRSCKRLTRPIPLCLAKLILLRRIYLQSSPPHWRRFALTIEAYPQ